MPSIPLGLQKFTPLKIFFIMLSRATIKMGVSKKAASTTKFSEFSHTVDGKFPSLHPSPLRQIELEPS
jgi:hypothetical protein